MTIPSKQRIHINGTPLMVETIERLHDQHGPFLSRHRLMRIAMREGLRAIAPIDMDDLRRLLVEDRDEAAR
jgi:hypothetical protein